MKECWQQCSRPWTRKWLTKSLSPPAGSSQPCVRQYYAFFLLLQCFTSAVSISIAEIFLLTTRFTYTSDQYLNMVSFADRMFECSNLCEQTDIRFRIVSPYNFFLIGIVGGGVQLGPLGTAATNRRIMPVPGDYDDGEIGGMIGRGNQSTRRKPAPVPLYPPQTPHAAWTRTRAAAGGNQRLTAWATARPIPYSRLCAYAPCQETYYWNV
jgi:hypothetical protein